MEAFRNNTETLILVSVGGIAVMAIVLTILSAKVVSPLVKNHQRQKEFITSASHELKTPLTVIHADAQLLESEIGENEWLSDIIKQTTNMTEMTHKLVCLARAEEQGKIILSKSNFLFRCRRGRSRAIPLCCSEQGQKLHIGYSRRPVLLRGRESDSRTHSGAP